MIQGTFKSRNGNEYTVQIECELNYEIGSTDMINFSDDPITITQDVDDTFEHIIKTTCTINLVANTYLGDYLFSGNDRDIPVHILKGTTCIFDGYLEPLSFSQDFSEKYCDIELNCIDFLSTLENHKYKETEDYDVTKVNARTVTFLEMIETVFGDDRKDKIWYDKSTSIYPDMDSEIFKNASVSELLVLGDEEDDLWTCEEVLTEILQYYNLHIVQIGTDFFIFSYENLKKLNTSSTTVAYTWYNIRNMSTTKTTTLNNINVDTTYYADTDTNISIADVYNKITVTCDLQNNEDLVSDLFEKSNQNSHFTYNYKFLEENTSGDDGESSTTKRKWYFRELTHKDWTFRWNLNNVFTPMEDVLNLIYTDEKYIGQYKLLNEMKSKPFSAMLCNMGSKNIDEEDVESAIAPASLSNTIVITLPNRRDIAAKLDKGGIYNIYGIVPWNYIDDFNAALKNAYDEGGIIEYKNKQSRGILSPTDSEATYYLVFKGKVSFQCYTPLRWGRGGDEDIKEGAWFSTWYKDENGARGITEYSKSTEVMIKPFLKNTSGSFWNGTLWNWAPIDAGVLTPTNMFWMPDKDDYKIPVFICEMSIGDKYLCEPTQEEYVWLTKDEAAAKGYTTFFSLGIHSKANSHFFNTEFSFPINLSEEDNANVDVEGTAIPIKASDGLTGQVNFKIIGINYLGNCKDMSLKPTFFNSYNDFWWNEDAREEQYTKETEGKWSPLNYTENIYINDFEVKLKTNNGDVNLINDDELDLIYTSDESNNSTQTKDDITFKFNTALGTQEAIDKGIKAESKLSYVMYNGSPLKGIINVGGEGKPEELYIDAYYNEYCKPRLLVETTMGASKVNYWDKFKFPYFDGKTFMTLSQTYNCKLDTKTLKLKEI